MRKSNPGPDPSSLRSRQRAIVSWKPPVASLRLAANTARKSDGPPGPKNLWLGWQLLADLYLPRKDLRRRFYLCCVEWKCTGVNCQ